MRIHLFAVAVGLIVVMAALLHLSPSAFSQTSASHAQGSTDDWQQEFDDVCSSTDYAMALTVDELKQRVSKCDSVRLRVEALEEPQRRVFLKRLQSCKDFYLFLIQTKSDNK